MISVKEALDSVNAELTKAEMTTLLLAENRVAAAIKEHFNGTPFSIPVVLSEVPIRVIHALKRECEKVGWNVKLNEGSDEKGEVVAVRMDFEPNMSRPSNGSSSVLTSLFNELATLQGVTTKSVAAESPSVTLSKTPLLSIIFGTFNRFECLKKAITSMRTSIGKHSYEIVVCDGGSTDGSREWLASQQDVVMVGDRHLTGAVPAFNHCFNLARGKFIANLNDDCVVEGLALSEGVEYLQKHPDAGQAAFKFALVAKDGKVLEDWHINKIYPDVDWPTEYVNFGITRKEAADQVVEITGGFWNPIYKTYSGDCELSAWIHKLGWKVARMENLRVTDVRFEDILREKNNVSSGYEMNLFGYRWPPAAMKPDGPLPNVTQEEKNRFVKVRDRSKEVVKALPVLDLKGMLATSVGWPEPQEEKRLAAQAPRVRALDPVEGTFPNRVDRMTQERVLHVHLGTDADPQAGLVRALQALGSLGYEQIRWLDFEHDERQQRILDAASRLQPTLIFMQLQTPNAVDVQTVKALRQVVKGPVVIATWCGDIASENSPYNAAWQVPLGRVCDLTLHSSLSHVHVLRSHGIHTAGYFQIGYDDEQYFPIIEPQFDCYGVSFLGSRYGNGDTFSQSMNNRHDGKLRDEVVDAMAVEFGDRFGLFGNGFTPARPSVALNKAHEVYQKSNIGLNISLNNDLKCYTSDRLFRIMGCGALALTKQFSMMSVYGLKHLENCLVWDTPEEAVALAKAVLAHPEDLQDISLAGATLALEHHTWNFRMLELIPYLNAIRGTKKVS